MADTWTAYERAYRELSPAIGAFMQALAGEFGATADEDCYQESYGWQASFMHGGIRYHAELRLNDASDYGDDEPGEQGNLYLSVIRDGGQIVIGWAPFNYTDECWVPYSDLDTLRGRVPDPSDASEAASAIYSDAARGDSDAGGRQGEMAL